MVGTQMNASARKEAELALQHSEANFRSLFELAPVGICQVEQPGGRFLMVNNSLVEATGYSREELLRMTYWDITPMEWHGEDRFAVGAVHRRRRLRFLTRRNTSARMAVAIRCWCRARTSPMPSGRRIGWAIVQDISERKAMELQLADAANRDRLTGPRQSRAVHGKAGRRCAGRTPWPATTFRAVVPGHRPLQAGERRHGP
ncbi:MAG: PAS domain S-box protein [Pseudomonadota bacterium]